MSGLEVVGVVLGALPLITSAFEYAQSVAKKWNMLSNFNSEHLKVWNDVKDEELMYRLQLQTLLAPLVRDDDTTKDQLETLLLSSQCNAWRDTDLEAALRRRLGVAYERYFGNVDEIETLTWQLLEPLARSSAFRARLSTKVCRTRMLNMYQLPNGFSETAFSAERPDDAEIVHISRTKVQTWK